MAEDDVPSGALAATNGTQTKAAGIRCETKVLVQRFNKNGECIVVEKDDKPNTKDQYAEYALVTKQTFDATNKLTGTQLEINSKHLLDVFREIITFYPHPLDFTSKLVLDDPFMMLFHHRQELREYRKTTQDDAAKMHIMLLLDYLEKEAGERDPEVGKLMAAKLITFPLLWFLFKPGDLMYQSKHGHDRIYRLLKTGYGQTNSRGKFFELNCAFVSYDGMKVGTAVEKLRIWEREEFAGINPSNILSLSLHPLKFINDGDMIIERLRERGEKYLAIREMCVMSYDGLFLYLKRPPYDYYNEEAFYDGTWLPEFTSGRVVIDPKTFNEEAKAQQEEVAGDDDGDKPSDDKEKDPKANETLQYESGTFCNELEGELTPPYVYGFSLEKKEWCKFFVDSLQAVSWKPNALDALILPADQKRLLRALVTSHKFPDKARDQAGLKGKGLVILLHGSPGSGKTLTAEMTAEHTHRALLNISTGELGSYRYYIEIALKRLLTYASTFGAIVLIDEADVFLEARGDSLAQNAMVAVFLRHLEYFQGIIFLTSNRVSVFDQAIKSRIHLALQYKPPSPSTRRLLWKAHLECVPLEERSSEFDIERAVEAVVAAEMNGRVISNSISTARTLAKSENVKLRIGDLETIVRVWEEFERVLLVKEGGVKRGGRGEGGDMFS